MFYCQTFDLTQNKLSYFTTNGENGAVAGKKERRKEERKELAIGFSYTQFKQHKR